MTTTYKLLKQYFLERDDSTSGGGGGLGGYYYGSGESGPLVKNDNFNNSFNSVEIDERFGPDANNTVSNIITLPDGKILLGGSFTTIDGVTIKAIARLNSDGTLDTSSSWIGADINDGISSMAIQPDGKILIVGFFTTIETETRNYVARLNSDGTLDSSFNPNVNGSVYALALQPDGKIIIGGNFNTVGGTTRNYIARLNSDGTLDTSFDTSAENQVYSVTLQADGKILIGGFFIQVDGVTRNSVARLNSDGTLDSSFNPNVTNTFFTPYVRTMVVQPDNKIIIGGDFNTVGGTTRNGIARLNSDGTLDTSFDPNANNVIYSIALQPDGKILIGGEFTNIGESKRDRIARLNSDGTLDTSFILNSDNVIYGISIQPDGKILIGGNYSTLNNIARTRVARIKEIVDSAPYKLVYTVPTGKSIILGSLFSTNHNDFPVYYDVAVVPYEDDVVSEKHYYVWDSLLEDNNFEVLKDKITLSAGDKIYVYSSTDENISFNLFGTEITA